MTLSARPTPIMVNNKDVPPELTKGRVRPVTGIRLRFIPMETTVWKNIIPAPVAVASNGGVTLSR